MRVLQGHERTAERRRPDAGVDPAATASHRYSVDELHAVARRVGRDTFPGVPPRDESQLSRRERTLLNDAIVRSLVARGVLGADGRSHLVPHSALFAATFSPEITCSVQRYIQGELQSRNAFLLAGLLVEQVSPSQDVIELRASDAAEFGGWLAQATNWSPMAAVRTELRQITRTRHHIRRTFDALAAAVPTTLEDQRVLDAGRVVTYRRSGESVEGVDLGWVTTVDAVWAFPKASDLLTGFDPGTAPVTLQVTTESELTRAVLRSIRPVAARSAG